MMKKHWEVKKLGEVGETQTGTTPKTSDKENYGNYIPFITPADIDISGDGTIRYREEGLSELGLKNGRKMKTNSILMVCIGASIGKVGFVDRDVSCNQQINSLTVKKGFCPKFFYYALSTKGFFEQVIKNSAQATLPIINKGKWEKLTISYPPSEKEQQRIVAILDEAFAAIATAKENAEKNLQNARELFESYLQGVDAEKESLGTLVDITTGKLDANAAKEKGQYPFFTCSREIFAIDKFAFDCESILLAGNNAVGDFNVKHYKGKFNAYQRTYVITVNKESRVLYRYLYFQMLKSLKEFKTKSVGAGTKFLKLGMIKDLRIALPSLPEQRTIVAKLDALSLEIKKLEAIYQQKLADLDELKKSVLQKAFNGGLA